MYHWSHTLRDMGPRLIQALVDLENSVPATAVLAFAVVLLGIGSFIGMEQRKDMAGTLLVLRGDVEILNMRLERFDSITALGERHDIDSGLGAAIVDVALAEGLAPDLGARLVRVESDFRARVVGGHGEIGLTQIKLSTARGLGFTGTRKDLFDRRTNLRYGFRYLRQMLDRYDGDLDRALTAYNGGPRLADSGYVLAYARKVCGGPCS